MVLSSINSIIGDSRSMMKLFCFIIKTRTNVLRCVESSKKPNLLTEDSENISKIIDMKITKKNCTSVSKQKNIFRSSHPTTTIINLYRVSFCKKNASLR